MFDGKEYELDLLIYATGFEVQKTGIYNRIVGRNGVDLEDKYSDGIRTLLGIHTQGFPNLFIMGGYQASFQFNLTDMLQTQGDHIAACIDYVRSNGIERIDPTFEAEEWWVNEVIAHRGKTGAQPGMHAGLLQLRRRVATPPGRQLQRRLQAVLRAPGRSARADAGELRVRVIRGVGLRNLCGIDESVPAPAGVQEPGSCGGDFAGVVRVRRVSGDAPAVEPAAGTR